MNALACVGCSRPAAPCGLCDRPASLHEHVYDEWWCRACWDAFAGAADSQDADCYRIEGVALDVIPLASGG